MKRPTPERLDVLELAAGFGNAMPSENVREVFAEVNALRDDLVEYDDALALANDQVSKLREELDRLREERTVLVAGLRVATEQRREAQARLAEAEALIVDLMQDEDENGTAKCAWCGAFSPDHLESCRPNAFLASGKGGDDE